MTAKDEILGADYSEHNIQPRPAAVEITANSNSSSNGRNEESQISQRSRNVQSEDDKMAGMYKTTYFTDESASDRSVPPTRVNLAYQHDVGA